MNTQLKRKNGNLQPSSIRRWNKPLQWVTRFALASLLVGVAQAQVTVYNSFIDTTTGGDYRTAGYGKCFALLPNPAPCTPPSPDVGLAFFADPCVEQPIGPGFFNCNMSEYQNFSQYSVCATGDFLNGQNQGSSVVDWRIFAPNNLPSMRAFAYDYANSDLFFHRNDSTPPNSSQFIPCANGGTGGFRHTTFDDDVYHSLSSDVNLTGVTGNVRLAYYFTAEPYQCRTMTVTLSANGTPIGSKNVNTCANAANGVYAVFDVSGLNGSLVTFTLNATGGSPNDVISGVFVSRPDGSACISQSNCSGSNCCQCPCDPHDIQYNFNGTQIIFQGAAANSSVWFISDGVVKNLPKNQVTTLTITSQTITIPATKSTPQFVIPVPDAVITFDPNATTATTTFSGGQWQSTFPTSGLSGNIFYAGVAFPVPPGGLPGGIKNVDWSGKFFTSTPGLTVSWQWHAANYSTFPSPGNYNAPNGVAPKPTDDNNASIYKNSDHAGTPEGTNPATNQPWKKSVVGGASGGGGSNYTGSGSSTISFPPCVCPVGD